MNKSTSFLYYVVLAISISACASKEIKYVASRETDLADVNFKLTTDWFPNVGFNRITIKDCKISTYQRMGDLDRDTRVGNTKIEAGEVFSIGIGAYQIPFPQAAIGGFNCYHAFSFKPVAGKRYLIEAKILPGCSAEVYELLTADGDKEIKIKEMSQTSIPYTWENDAPDFCKVE
jgi:hypothetical protein